MTTVNEDDKIIVITEGEFDAMAVHQETGLPCVSLPNGANSLPISLLKFFERFERIYLWLDADEVGQNAVEKFSKVIFRYLFNSFIETRAQSYANNKLKTER
jgi:twinkle protein